MQHKIVYAHEVLAMHKKNKISFLGRSGAPYFSMRIFWHFLHVTPFLVTNFTKSFLTVAMTITLFFELIYNLICILRTNTLPCMLGRDGLFSDLLPRCIFWTMVGDQRALSKRKILLIHGIRTCFLCNQLPLSMCVNMNHTNHPIIHIWLAISHVKGCLDCVWVKLTRS